MTAKYRRLWKAAPSPRCFARDAAALRSEPYDGEDVGRRPPTSETRPLDLREEVDGGDWGQAAAGIGIDHIPCILSMTQKISAC